MELLIEKKSGKEGLLLLRQGSASREVKIKDLDKFVKDLLLACSYLISANEIQKKSHDYMSTQGVHFDFEEPKQWMEEVTIHTLLLEHAPTAVVLTLQKTTFNSLVKDNTLQKENVFTVVLSSLPEFIEQILKDIMNFENRENLKNLLRPLEKYLNKEEE